MKKLYLPLELLKKRGHQIAKDSDRRSIQTAERSLHNECLRNFAVIRGCGSGQKIDAHGDVNAVA